MSWRIEVKHGNCPDTIIFVIGNNPETLLKNICELEDNKTVVEYVITEEE